MMQLADLMAKLQLREWQESETVEWKSSTKEMKEIVRSAVAFANTRGGVIVIGVKDDGTLIGQDVTDSTIREVAQTLLANSEEKLSFSLDTHTVDGRRLISVLVPESPLRPHLAYGRPVKRVGSVVTAMSQQEYHQLLGTRANGGGADRDLAPDSSIDDINRERVEEFLARANERRSTNFSLIADTEQILDTLELRNAGVLTKGALLLFGYNPQRFLPQAEMRLAHFADSNKTRFLDQSITTGDLFQQLEKSLEFIKERLPERINTLKEGSRIERIPPVAVFTELIANALIHRDYRDPASSYVNIVAQDEVEVNNPGVLLAPRITPATMALSHPSLPVNRRLARVFFLAGLIEQWGLGTVRAARLMVESGLPAPVWTNEHGTVSVRCLIKQGTAS